MGRTVLLALTAAALLVVSGCTGTGDSGASDSTSTTSATAEQSTTEGSNLTASTLDSTTSTAATTTTTIETTTTSTTTTATTTATSSSSSSSTTSAEGSSVATTPISGVLLQPGNSGEFTSPSGNIACLMSTALGVNCWISEKQWTIPQPSDPDCALFDYGNAVVVRANGIQWPCYSDFIWNPNAPALPYGDGMQVGEFICRSAEDGVSCNNSQDQGFRLARAEVVVF